jgi:predicted transcriptional regulator
MVDILATNLDEATIKRLKELAKARRISFNNIACKALDAYVSDGEHQAERNTDKHNK